MNKGFVIAVDVLLGLLVLFIIITLSFSLVQQTGGDVQTQVRLKSFAENAAATLENSRDVSLAVASDNTARIRSFLNSFPVSICGKISVYPSPDVNVPILAVSKTGCASSTGAEESVRRGIIVPNPPDVNLYVALVSVWVNRA